MGVIDGLNNDIVSFTRAETKLIYVYRFNINTIGLYNRHFYAWNSDIVKRPSSTIYKSKSDLLTFIEDTSPISIRGCSVH